MKMRNMNHLIAVISVIASILTLIAVLTGMHTLFGIISASVTLAVSLGMYLRVVVGTAALQMAEKQEKLVRFAIAQHKDPAVVQQFAEWVKQGDMEFKGAQVANLIKAADENGEWAGFWLLLIGSQSSYEQIRKELDGYATIVDHWPIDPEEWSHVILTELKVDEDPAEGSEGDAEPDIPSLP